VEMTSTLSRIVRRGRAALLLSAVLSSAVAAQQHFTVVAGKVTWDSTKGNPNIPNARVQIMDPAFPKTKRVWKSTTADAAAEYAIENVAEGAYDIAACDDRLKYRPQLLQGVAVRQGRNVSFRLTRNEEAGDFKMKFDKPTVVYLKNIETGCELDAMLADRNGAVKIPIADERTLYSKYVLCFDDAVEDDSISPFESCRKRELPLGMTQSEVGKALGRPDKKVKLGTRELLYVYKDVKVAFLDGKISDVKVELEPTPCLLGLGCRTN
jgi:hypothetical protein